MGNQLKPSTIMMIGGGAVLFIASFLDWRDFGGIGSNTDFIGLQWLFTLLIGAGVAALVALSAFANVKLPEQILGFSLTQLYAALGLAAFLITFGQQFAEQPGAGIILGWIGAGVLTGGAVWELVQGGSGSAPRSTTPPTPF